MKKGFTLVELLAVIVILGVVSLIATNVIVGLIEDSKKDALLLKTQKTVSNIISYRSLYEMDTGLELKDITYTISDNKIYEIELKDNGSFPKEGEVNINKEGAISIYAYENGYCAAKSALETEVKVSKKNKEDCTYNSNSTKVSGSQITLTNAIDKSIESLTIYGNSVQEGIPSPDYPSEINSIGNENLFDYTKFPATNTAGGVTVINNNDGSFNVTSVGSTATANENGKLRYDITDLLKKYGEQTYVISGDNGNTHPYIFIDLYYNGTNYYNWLNSSSSSDNIKTITKEILFYSDFKATIGIRYNNGSTIFSGIIYPSLKISNADEINYFDYTKFSTFTAGGVTITNNSNGSFDVTTSSGTSTAASGKSIDITDALKANGEQTYRISIGSSDGSDTPYAFVNLYYNGSTVYNYYLSKSNSSIEKVLTEEILSYPDFKANLGIYWTNNVSITNHKITPEFRMVKSKNSGNTSLLVNGKNLFDLNSSKVYFNLTGEINNNNIKLNDLGVNTWASVLYNIDFEFEYTFSAVMSGNQNPTIRFSKNAGAAWDDRIFYDSGNKLFKFTYDQNTSNVDYVGIYFYPAHGQTASASNYANFSNIQLERGSEATEYEPYKETIVNYPVTLRSLPDGTKDKLVIDNANKRAYVERKVGNKVFDGSETLTLKLFDDINNFEILIPDGVGNDNQLTTNSSHFTAVSGQPAYNGTIGNVSGYGTSKTYRFRTNDFTSAESFKSYLASEYSKGTPITVQYKLATPVIEELEYIPIQNYENITNISLNNVINPSNIEVVYTQK